MKYTFRGYDITQPDGDGGEWVASNPQNGAVEVTGTFADVIAHLETLPALGE